MTPAMPVRFETALLNTIVAAALAVVAWVATVKCRRHPSIVLLCWWIVLIRLVIPPLFVLPVRNVYVNVDWSAESLLGQRW